MLMHVHMYLLTKDGGKFMCVSSIDEIMLSLHLVSHLPGGISEVTGQNLVKLSPLLIQQFTDAEAVNIQQINL